jgi:hypothetical protein
MCGVALPMIWPKKRQLQQRTGINETAAAGVPQIAMEVLRLRSHVQELVTKQLQKDARVLC